VPAVPAAPVLKMAAIDRANDGFGFMMCIP
jgi:hypothetical protein